MGQQPIQHGDEFQRLLVAGAPLLVLPYLGPLDDDQVRQRELGDDGLDVRERVDPSVDVDDVRIVEAADDVDDGVCLADVGGNWLPRPSPLLAPATRPTISTNSTIAGWIFCGLTIAASCARRGSGTSTMPTFGSIVQNG